MSRSMTVSETRASLPSVLDRVEAGEEVAITRHGRVVAVMVRPDVLRARRAASTLAAAAELHDLLELGRRSRLDETAPISSAEVDEMVAHLRAGRRGR